VRKLLIGCGVAVAALVLLLVVGGVIGFQWVKSQMPHMDELKQSRQTLLERFGPRDEFVPALDGVLHPERVELFMAVRESLLTTRGEVGVRLEGFIGRTKGNSWEGRSVFQKIVEGLNMARGGVGLFGEATTYVGNRARWLLDAGMGEGEYTYLFCLMAYSWLEWDASRVLDAQWFESHDMAESLDEFRMQHRRLFVKQLRNARRELEAKTDRSAAENATLEMVTQALEVARGDDFPFQGAVPPAWAAVLEPYRQRFEATLPRAPGEYILESVEQLIDEEDKRGFHIQRDQ